MTETHQCRGIRHTLSGGIQTQEPGQIGHFENGIFRGFIRKAINNWTKYSHSIFSIPMDGRPRTPCGIEGLNEHNQRYPGYDPVYLRDEELSPCDSALLLQGQIMKGRLVRHSDQHVEWKPMRQFYRSTQIQTPIKSVSTYRGELTKSPKS